MDNPNNTNLRSAFSLGKRKKRLHPDSRKSSTPAENRTGLNVQVFSDQGCILHQFIATGDETVAECLSLVCSGWNRKTARSEEQMNSNFLGLCKFEDKTWLISSYTLRAYFPWPYTEAKLVLVKAAKELKAFLSSSRGINLFFNHFPFFYHFLCS